MNPVTDPNLIAQLGGNETQPKPVTDPNLLAQLEGNNQQQSQQMPGYLRYPLDALIGLGQAGQGIANFPHKLFYLLLSRELNRWKIPCLE